VFDALLDSFLNDTEIEFAIMDGAIGTSGSQGLRAYMQVFDFPYSQELENLESFDVGLDLTPFEESGSEIDPDWFEVS